MSWPMLDARQLPQLPHQPKVVQMRLTSCFWRGPAPYKGTDLFLDKKMKKREKIRGRTTRKREMVEDDEKT